MKTKLFIIILITISAISCDQKTKNKTGSYNYHQIANLKGSFPLAEEYKPITGEERIKTLEEKGALFENILKSKIKSKQTHFINTKNENNLITITNAVTPIPLAKEFAKSFAKHIENETFDKFEKNDFDLIENKFLTSENQNKSLKAKFRIKKGKYKYFTVYLLTTQSESFFVTVFNDKKSDIQNSIIEYLRKN